MTKKPNTATSDKQAAKKAVVKRAQAVPSVEALPNLDEEGLVRAIIETPKHSRNKYKYEPETGMFECAQALQGGLTFPIDFGFVPSTRAEDGDPLDVMILMDEPAFAGCLVHAKIIGVLEAQQTQEARTFRNDRLLGVHNKSVEYGEYESWHDVPKAVLKELELFFIMHNKTKGKVFEVIGWKGAAVAMQTLNKTRTNPK